MANRPAALSLDPIRRRLLKLGVLTAATMMVPAKAFSFPSPPQGTQCGFLQRPHRRAPGSDVLVTGPLRSPLNQFFGSRPIRLCRNSGEVSKLAFFGR
jgi:hypothetical protein